MLIGAGVHAPRQYILAAKYILFLEPHRMLHGNKAAIFRLRTRHVGQETDACFLGRHVCPRKVLAVANHPLVLRKQ